MSWEGLNPPYATIVADPPWAYERQVQGTTGNVGWFPTELPYSSMSVEEIAALPVAEITNPGHAFLFLWTTNRYLHDALHVLERWGFLYRQALVWSKGDASPFASCVAPNSAEFLLVGCHPAGCGRMGTVPSSIVHANRGAHSAKPDAFLDLVEQVAPGPYCELFARAPRLGWDHWGYGYETERVS